MTAELPAPLTRVRDIRDDTPPDGWVPDIAGISIPRGVAWYDEPQPAPLPQVVVDLAVAFNLDEQAADWRTLAAWARTTKKTITAAKRQRSKDLRAWRKQHGITGGTP